MTDEPIFDEVTADLGDVQLPERPSPWPRVTERPDGSFCEDRDPAELTDDDGVE